MTAAQPALTRVCRQVRSETLPMFYALNQFDLHEHRCDFGYLISWMNAIGLHNGKQIRTVRMQLMDRWSCGRGLLDFVRWCATAEGIFDEKIEIVLSVSRWNEAHAWQMDPTELQLVRGDPWFYVCDTVKALIGAMGLAKNIRVSGRTFEGKLRKDFKGWLSIIAFDCKRRYCAEVNNDFDGLCGDARTIRAEPSKYCCSMEMMKVDD